MKENEAKILLCQMYLPQFDEEEKQALTIAIEALEEKQQYSEIGTVEDIRNTHLLCEVFSNAVRDYTTIGTIEELKALKEKSMVKKPDFTEDKQFALCPNISCNSKGLKDKQQYCDCCGQKLDWQ